MKLFLCALLITVHLVFNTSASVIEGSGEGSGEEEEVKLVEESYEASAEEDLCSEIGAVSNLTLTQTGDALTAVWDAPANPYGCEITYQVTYDNDLDSGTVVFTTEATFLEFPENLIPCTAVVVTVTAVSSEAGPTVTSSIVAETRAQDTPKLYNFTTSCNTIQMTWVGNSFEENTCEVTHFQLLCRSEEHSFTINKAIDDIKYRVFDIVITELRPDIFYYCYGFIFVTSAGFSPASETIEVKSDLEVITDLVITESENSLRAQWSPPVNSEGCGVVYEVILKNKDLGTIVVNETEELSVEFDVELTPCSITTITVTPIAKTGSRGVSSTETNIASLRDIGPVGNLRAVNGRAEWDPPANKGRCVVSYVVVHENDIGTKKRTTYGTEIDFPLVPCSWNLISVIALFGSLESIPQQANYNASEPTVSIEDIEFVEGNNTLLVTWAPPAIDIGVCDIFYTVAQSIPGTAVLVFGTTLTEQPLKFVGCAKSEVTIAAIVGDVTGNDTTEFYTTGISNIGPVENLRISLNGIEWNRPLDAGNCDISYLVRFQDNFHVYTAVTDEKSYLYRVVPCSAVSASVTPFVDDDPVLVNGTTANLITTAPPAALSAPRHILTVPSFTGANITVEGESYRENFCTITQAIVRCVNPDEIASNLAVIIADNPSRTFTLNVNNLGADAIYNCTVLWIIQGSPAGSQLSEPIAFRTIPVKRKSLRIVNIGTDAFTVEWDEPYGKDFVSKYTVSISMLGPKHFVYAGCDVPVVGSYVTALFTRVNYFNFTKAYPNYNYDVELTTAYTLGKEVTTDTKAVSTLPGVPGTPKRLRAAWRYGVGQQFNVSAAVTWDLPCDIHGHLSHFGVTVTTLGQIGNREVQYEDTYDVSANDPIEKLNYTFTVADLNPFFTYLVAVNTVTVHKGASETLVVIPPRACICASRGFFDVI